MTWILLFVTPGDQEKIIINNKHRQQKIKLQATGQNRFYSE